MKLPAIGFDQKALSDFSEAIQKEWLVTNSLGGYASSTVLGINTRKYHGLLVAALDPPGNRTVCLSKLDEDAILDNDVYHFSANEFIDVIYPQGHKFLKAFSISPFPSYIYGFAGFEISKTIFVSMKKNTVSVIYKVSNQNSNKAMLRIYPLLACRYFHTTVDRRKNPFDFALRSNGKEFETTFAKPQVTVLCRSTGGEFKEEIIWIDRLFYRVEASRGEASIDDCFRPGYFEVQVHAEEEKEFAVSVAANHESQTARKELDGVGSSFDEVNRSYNRELVFQSDLLQNFYNSRPEVPVSDWFNWVLLAANSFIVENQLGKKAVIAGYFWFEPWGRDTFISLPGLMLVTGRFNDARSILQDFIQYCKNGLIPNFLSDRSGEPSYNTVDGTLWYINGVLQYLKYTGDFAFVREELWENLQAIIDHHEQGTLFGIRLDNDGLIMHGSRLTWMDAAVGGKEITPRVGKAVEIQALWYNALRIMELLANRFEETELAEKYANIAIKTSRSFSQKFWNARADCLFDVVDANFADASLRPNQIFAVSLDFSMLDNDKSNRVVAVVNRELVTPYGLRTLSLDDPKFVGKCFGDRATRDLAYHNGTIWPWLLGPFVTAYLKAKNSAAQPQEYAMHLLSSFFNNGIHQACLGTLNEIYDCDMPNTPRGCVAQAWSVAEPLRAYLEDLLKIKPKYMREVFKA
jgi:predicted glycogen debranching enzyme